MRLALDTNAYRAVMSGREDAVRLASSAETLGMPVPVLGELRYGFAGGTRLRQNEAALLKFLDSPRVKLLACDEQTTHFYAAVMIQLKRQGTPIPSNDAWIAALALQHGMTLLTYDRHFDHLPQLPRP